MLNNFMGLLSKQNERGAEARFLNDAGYSRLGETKPDDIFLVGFPKSGNTWLQNLVAGTQYGMDTRFLTDKLTQLLVPNVHGHGFYKRVDAVTCFKSHFLPRPEYRRVVNLVRDGRDAMVSYFHMNNAVSESPVCMRSMIVNGEGVFPCKWNQHVRQWLDNPFGSEILTIRYEDLLLQPLVEMKRFCKFANLEREDELLVKCIEGNSFQQMQVKEQTFGWDNQGWDAEQAFIRRGEVGSHQDEMPQDLIDYFELESEAELTRFSYPLAKSN